MKKNKTSGKRYYAEEDANIGNLLKNAGYEFGNVGENTRVGSDQVLRNLANVTNMNVSGDPRGLAGAMDGYLSGLTNIGDGKSVPAGLLDVYGGGTGLNAITGALGLGSLGSAVGGLFGAGSSSKESKADAAGFRPSRA